MTITLTKRTGFDHRLRELGFLQRALQFQDPSKKQFSGNN